MGAAVVMDVFWLIFLFSMLAPVVQQLAVDHGLQVRLVADDADDSELANTDWVLASRTPALRRFSNSL